MKYKIKRFFSNVFKSIHISITFPVFWVAIIIIIGMICSLAISNYYNEIDEAYLSSIFANIFAGLITGLTITVLSGTKSVYVAYLEGKLEWLAKTHEMILLHFHKKNELLHSITKTTDDGFFELAYDAGGTANHVNERIMQSTFDKVKWFDPSKYLKKKHNYNCIEMSSVLNELKETIQCYGEDSTKRKFIIDEIQDKTRNIHILNHDILEDINILKIRIAASKKSVI